MEWWDKDHRATDTIDNYRECWIAATKSAEEKFNSAPAANGQLKAEISGVLDSMQHHISDNNYRTMQFYINELRQKLSAV